MISLLHAVLIALVFAGEPLPQPDVWTVAPHKGSGGRVLFVEDEVLSFLARDPEFALDYAAEVKADESGKVAHDFLQSGWAYTPYRSKSARTVVVTGRGFHSLFVNGERFAGDFYRLGILRIAVPLKAGVNHLMVRAIRGEFTLRIEPAEGTLSLSPRDPTMPDLREGELIDLPAAVVLLNQTGETLGGATLEVGDGQVFASVRQPLFPVIPYGLAKPAFRLAQLREPKAAELDEKGRYPLRVTLLHQGEVQAEATYPIPVRKAGDAYVETRVSGIDGSVQYHAVRRPATVEPGKRYALYLSLHGAGVMGRNQASAYGPKRDAYIVAPTNRRRYGFDWQDWGRLDALEALDFALERYPIDPNRVYLTGHSMGGHGAWYLGALYSSRFAAVCPSAGWESFFSYGGGMPRKFGDAPRLAPFNWTLLENDTMAMLRNLRSTPVYVLHGEKDDNVPVTQARRMVEELEKFHDDFLYHEQPGAGHWWGSECVDWIPLFEFCRKHTRVETPLSFRFTTVNPAVSGVYAWATIHKQDRLARPSTIEVSADPRKGTVAVKTENVTELELDLRGVVPMERVKLTIDGRELEVAATDGAYFARWPHGEWEEWAFDEGTKSARLGGPFKLAFNRNMVWVYGTGGTPEENAATLAKVRYDAQVWWYRGNGNVRILADRDFDPLAFTGRNVILYGNADTNSACAKVLPDCPLEVARGKVKIGDEVYSGDLGLFLTYPRADSPGNLVGLVGATTARVMRIAQQSRYFVSGTAVPDWVLWTPATLEKGMEGVAASGYFDAEWRLVR